MTRKQGDTTDFRVIAILFMTFGSVILDRMASLYLGPYLVKDLNLSASQIGLLASATSICWALSALLFGAISDRIGRRPVLIPAVFAFSLCSVLSGTADNFYELLLYRALLGLAEGPCWSVVMALAEAYSPAEHRGRNIGIVNSAGVLSGGAIAPLFTTQVASAYSWQWGFYGAAIPGLISGLLLLFFVKEPKRREETEAVQSVRDFLQLTRYRNLWLCAIAGFCVSICVFSFNTFAPLYITQTMKQSATMSGFLLGISGFGGFVWSFFGMGIADRIGRKSALILFALLSAATPLAFMVPSLYHTPWVLAGLAFVLMTNPSAAGLTLFLIPAETVPRHFVASAIGFAGIGADFFGATLAPIIGGALADAYGLAVPMQLAIGGALLMVAVSLMLRETLIKRAAATPDVIFEHP